LRVSLWVFWQYIEWIKPLWRSVPGVPQREPYSGRKGLR